MLYIKNLLGNMQAFLSNEISPVVLKWDTAEASLALLLCSSMGLGHLTKWQKPTCLQLLVQGSMVCVVPFSSLSLKVVSYKLSLLLCIYQLCMAEEQKSVWGDHVAVLAVTDIIMLWLSQTVLHPHRTSVSTPFWKLKSFKISLLEISTIQILSIN